MAKYVIACCFFLSLSVQAQFYDESNELINISILPSSSKSKLFYGESNELINISILPSSSKSKLFYGESNELINISILPSLPILSLSLDTLHLTNALDSFYVKSTGEDTLHLSRIYLSRGDSSKLEIEEVNVSVPIAPEDSLKVKVSLASTFFGTEYLVIESNSPTSPDTLVLRSQPSLSLAALSLNPDHLSLFKHGGIAHYYLRVNNTSQNLPAVGFQVRYTLTSDSSQISTSHLSQLSDSTGLVDLNIDAFSDGSFPTGSYSVGTLGLHYQGRDIDDDVSTISVSPIDLVPLRPTSRKSGFIVAAGLDLEGCVGCVGVGIQAGDLAQAEIGASLLTGKAGQGLGVDIALSPVWNDAHSDIASIDLSVSGNLSGRASATAFAVSAKAKAAGVNASATASFASAEAEIEGTREFTLPGEDIKIASLQLLYLMLEQSRESNRQRWFTIGSFIRENTFGATKLQLFESLHTFLEERGKLPKDAIRTGNISYSLGYAGRLSADVGPNFDFDLDGFGLKVGADVGVSTGGAIGFGHQTSYYSGNKVERSFSTLMNYNIKQTLELSASIGSLNRSEKGKKSFLGLNADLIDENTTFNLYDRLFEMSTVTESGTLSESSVSWGATRNFSLDNSIIQQDISQITLKPSALASLNAISSENSIAGYISQNNNAASYVFDTESPFNLLANMSGYLVENYQSTWNNNEYTGSKFRSYTKSSSWDFSFSLKASLGIGGKIGFKGDFSTYNKNNYLIAKSAFEPASGVLLPTVEHDISDATMKENIDNYHNLEVQYLQSKFVEALDYYKADLQKKVAIFLVKKSINIAFNVDVDWILTNTKRLFGGAINDDELNSQMASAFSLQHANFSNSLVAPLSVQNTAANTFSTLEFSGAASASVFPNDAVLEYDYFFPDGEVYGTTEDSTMFLTISDIFYFSATDSNGDVIDSASTPGYNIKAQPGSDDKTFGELVGSEGTVGLYFKADEDSPWELLTTFEGTEVKNLSFTKMGRFAFGVPVTPEEEDTTAPTINVSIPENPESNDEIVRISWSDDQGINPSSVVFSVGDTTISPSLTQSHISIKLSQLPSNLGDFAQVSVSDHAGNQTKQTISSDRLNRWPEAISLNQSSILENMNTHTFVGVLSTEDMDADDMHTYTLSGTDSSSFTISNDSLLSNAVFDYESKSSYSISVTSTDAGGLTVSKDFTINITDVSENVAPTAIALNKNSIDENATIGTLVGILTTSDSDVDDTHSYTLSGTDVSSFTISNDSLFSNVVFDYESKSSYSISVTSTDAGDLSVSEDFTISITEVSENVAPTSIALSKNNISENATIGTLVGILTTSDSDVDDTHSYTLSGTDASSFTISNDSLLSNAVFGYETKASYSISVTSTDAGGLTVSKDFTISITDVSENDAPSSIALSKNNIADNSTIGSLVGTLTTSDSDVDDTHSYTLSGTDAGSFTISNDSLLSNAVFDYETKASYSISVTSTDAGGLSVSKDFTISITDVSENVAPTSIALSNNNIAENATIGTLVGTLTTSDLDADDTHTYTLSGTDASNFTISNDSLISNAVFDYETKSSYSISVTSTDAGGLNVSKDFTIEVIDVNEVITSVGDQESFNNELVLFPNPSYDVLNLQVENDVFSTVTWELIDLRGNILLRGEFPKNSKVSTSTIDVSSLISGVYFMRVIQLDQMLTKSVIIR